MPGPEGLVLGEGHHLPDARVLQDFDFAGPNFSPHVWPIPAHPEAVLRVNRYVPLNEEEGWDLAKTGITHLQALQDNGISIHARSTFHHRP